MPWAKGQSGNPGGGPKGRSLFRRLILDETKRGEELVTIALQIARSAEKDTDRMRALEFLAAYAFGKPTERVEMDATVESFDPLAGTSAERAARVRHLLDQAGIVLTAAAKRVPVAAGAD